MSSFDEEWKELRAWYSEQQAVCEQEAVAEQENTAYDVTVWQMTGCRLFIRNF